LRLLKNITNKINSLAFSNPLSGHGNGLAHDMHAGEPRNGGQEVFLAKIRRWTSVITLVVVAGLSIGVRAASAEDDSARKVKSKVSPVYPELARRMNLTGTVKVEVVIGPNGVVKNTKVIGGHPVLVEPAIDAVKKWRYEPSPADTTATVEFHFNNNQ
jgi:protein TonB